MRCYFEGKVKTSADSISVDFIEIVKCSNGKTIVLDWDDSEIGFDDIPDEDGYRPFSGRLIGIKFDGEYANGIMVGEMTFLTNVTVDTKETGDLLKDGKKIAPIIIWFDKKFIK